MLQQLFCYCLNLSTVYSTKDGVKRSWRTDRGRLNVNQTTYELPWASLMCSCMFVYARNACLTRVVTCVLPLYRTCYRCTVARWSVQRRRCRCATPLGLFRYETQTGWGCLPTDPEVDSFLGRRPRARRVVDVAIFDLLRRRRRRPHARPQPATSASPSPEMPPRRRTTHAGPSSRTNLLHN